MAHQLPKLAGLSMGPSLHRALSQVRQASVTVVGTHTDCQHLLIF